MHDLGVLGAVVPEFGRITAHHQHDLYHVYTVDVHTLFARCGGCTRCAPGTWWTSSPSCPGRCATSRTRCPLYLGMLLHDAGKGMGGNHSEPGRVLMATLGERLGPHRRASARWPSSSSSTT